MKKTVKAGLGYTIGNYLLKGIAFLTLPIFSRLMSQSDFGLYNLFLAYESILFIIIGCAIHSSYKNARYKYELVSEGAQEGYDYYTYISNTLLFVCINGGVFLLVSFIPLKWNKILGLTNLSVSLLVVYSFSIAVITCYNSYLGIRYDYKSFLKISAVNSILSIILSLYFVCIPFKDNKYFGRILGGTIPVFIISIVIVSHFWKQAKPHNFIKNIQWGIKYSLPIIPHGVSQVILSQFDRIMITKMIGSSEAGIYSFAYTIYTIVIITSQSLDNVWMPWVYEQLNNRNKENIYKKSCLYIGFMTIFTVVMMLASPEIIIILGSKKYIESIFCVLPLISSGFFSFLYTLPACIEYYYEKTKYIMIGSIIAAAVNVGLNFVAIPIWGYAAAAYTTLITYVLYFILHYAIANKIEKLNFYPSKYIFVCSILILLSTFLISFLINMMVIRWGIIVLLLIVTFVYEEKNIGIVGRIKRSFLYNSNIGNSKKEG